MPSLLFIVALAVIVIVGIIGAIAAKRRREAMQALANQLGFSYLADGLGRHGGFLTLTENARFASRFDLFHPFGQGERRDIANLVYGRRGEVDWTIFDYSYETQSTDSEGKSQTTTHRHGVVAARVPLTFPSLTLTPENFFHRVGAKLGLSELTFELEEFNRRYFIRSSDPKLAYDLLHPRAIEFLMGRPTRDWQFGGFYILLVKSGSYTPAEIVQAMDEIDGFLALIPSYYRQDRGFVPRWTTPLD